MLLGMITGTRGGTRDGKRSGIKGIREGVKTPSHGKSPLGGYPPLPPGASTDKIFL